MWNLLFKENKNMVLKRNYDKRGKVVTLQQYEMQEVIKQRKWTIINCSKDWSSFKKDDAVYMMILERSSLWWASPGESNEWLKEVMLPVWPIQGSNKQKVSRISYKRKRTILHQDNTRM